MRFEGRISGAVDIPHACCSPVLPIAIFDFDVKPSATGLVVVDHGQRAISS
ncbi:acetamidase/formamidase family protein [Carbonactinospora thermoautotrophica]|uniref:acetamidase/formamidase family protein n=1 Tax=Carbonactinospora thermoautotrophica TaxID=1469144 RepID=UPI00226F0649|nr:acetamidase/formamidase family protein [Carbonactinospora thermoautotrophica]